MRTVPYYTHDDESQWSGHIWRQRRYNGGPWGYAWEVLPPYAESEDAAAGGWCKTQAEAESRMNEVLNRCSEVTE